MSFRDVGPTHLNGPVLEGYTCRVVAGDVTVLVTAPSKDAAEGIAAFLEDAAHKASHTYTGQPPWYKNDTKAHDLSDQTAPRLEEPPRARKQIAAKRGLW